MFKLSYFKFGLVQFGCLFRLDVSGVIGSGIH